MLTLVEECTVRIMSKISLSGATSIKIEQLPIIMWFGKCHCFFWHLHVSPLPPEDKWCPLTATSPMAFSPPVICQSPLITQHEWRKKKKEALFGYYNAVKQGFNRRKKKRRRVFPSKPLMNKFPLSKQHGLVLMLQRAMEEEEEKKKANVKREERDLIVLKI